MCVTPGATYLITGHGGVVTAGEGATIAGAAAVCVTAGGLGTAITGAAAL